MTGMIYNSTDGPLTIDRAGRQLAARDRVEVDAVDGSPLAGHISAGRIVVLDEDASEQPDEDPQPKRSRKQGSATTTTQEA